MDNNETRNEIKELFVKITNMGFLSERAIENATLALLNKDKDLARKVIDSDKDIDELYKDIEKESLKILLLFNPFANDFLEVSSALKMITDLERIGDYAVDIALEVVSFPDNVKYIKKLEHIKLMSEIVISMVQDGVKYYIDKDVENARGLEKRDDKVDELFNLIKEELITKIKEKEENADQAIIFMMIAKYLERIGDHAVNIGEWVDYSITGSHSLS